MKLFRNSKRNITKDKKSGNVPHLEITEVLLVHCYIVNNYYQQDSRVLYLFNCNELIGWLLDLSPKKFIVIKTFYSKLSCTEVLFTDQNSEPLQMQDKININLFIKESVKYKN